MEAGRPSYTCIIRHDNVPILLLVPQQWSAYHRALRCALDSDSPAKFTDSISSWSDHSRPYLQRWSFERPQSRSGHSAFFSNYIQLLQLYSRASFVRFELRSIFKLRPAQCELHMGGVLVVFHFDIYSIACANFELTNGFTVIFTDSLNTLAPMHCPRQVCIFHGRTYHLSLVPWERMFELEWEKKRSELASLVLEVLVFQ